MAIKSVHCLTPKMSEVKYKGYLVNYNYPLKTSSEVLVGNRLMETWGLVKYFEKKRAWAFLQIICANLCALVRLVAGHSDGTP